MKRSEINQKIRWAEDVLERYRFPLPRFARWGMDEWRKMRASAAEIFVTGLGWDITDFGSGDFDKIGAVLFTVRNGVHDRPGVGSPYAEKLILLRDGQRLPCHYHAVKTEDIINRGGAALWMRLFNRLPDGGVDTKTDVTVFSDGIRMTVGAGEKFCVSPGDSVRLTPYTYHIFGAEGGDLVVGEVSSVNDDHTDNYFSEPTARFPDVEEDEEILHPLIGDLAGGAF